MKAIKFLTGFAVALGLSATAHVFAESSVETKEALPQTLFTNVHVFDGQSKKRLMNANVLVEGNLIKTVSTKPITAASATVVDGGGRTLLPGFIEGHAHLMLMGPSLPDMEAKTTWEDFGIHGTRMAEMYLMQGNKGAWLEYFC